MNAREFGSVSLGEAIPELRRTVTREDLIAYARAGGDHNPLHRDDEVARAAGFPTVIAHGMFTMGHMAACVAAWAGDPGSILHLSAQFRAPVYVGEEIVAGGTVKGLDPEAGIATVETWVTVTREGNVEHAVRKGAARILLRRS